MPSITPTPHPIDPDSSQSFLVQKWKTSFLDLKVDLISKIATQLIKISIHPEPSSPQSSEPKDEANGIKSKSTNTYDFRPLCAMFSANKYMLSLNQNQVTVFSYLNSIELLITGFFTEQNQYAVIPKHKANGLKTILKVISRLRTNDQPIIELAARIIYAAFRDNLPKKNQLILMSILIWSSREEILWNCRQLQLGRNTVSQKDKETITTFNTLLNQNGYKVIKYIESEDEFLSKINEILKNEPEDIQINVQQIKESRQSLPSTPNNLMDATIQELVDPLFQFYATKLAGIVKDFPEDVEKHKKIVTAMREFCKKKHPSMKPIQILKDNGSLDALETMVKNPQASEALKQKIQKNIDFLRNHRKK